MMVQLGCDQHSQDNCSFISFFTTIEFYEGIYTFVHRDNFIIMQNTDICILKQYHVYMSMHCLNDE